MEIDLLQHGIFLKFLREPNHRKRIPMRTIF